MTDLSDPDKFELSDIVTKNSKTGITSNKRLLVLKKGHLYYYSTVPSTYKGNIKSLENYHELPKCSIEILNIKKINGFEANSNYFSIEFEARHMMEREDIRKTMTLEEFNFAPKNTKQMITWQFTCDNQFVKQKWVNALETLHKFYGKQKINIQKFFENINKKQDEKVPGNAMRSSLMVPWRDDQMHKSNSNESLRRSNMGNLTPRVSTSNQSPSNTKKSVSSQQKNQSPQSKLNPGSTTQEIVDSFMKLEKTKSAHEPSHPVLEQSIEQSITTPRKLALESPKKDLLSSKSKNEEFNEPSLNNITQLQQKLFEEKPSQKQQKQQKQKKQEQKQKQQNKEKAQKQSQDVEEEEPPPAQIVEQTKQKHISIQKECPKQKQLQQKQQQEKGELQKWENKQYKLKKTDSNLIVEQPQPLNNVINEQQAAPILPPAPLPKTLSSKNQDQIAPPASNPFINHNPNPSSNLTSKMTSDPIINLKSNPIINPIQTFINESKALQRQYKPPKLQVKKLEQQKEQVTKINKKLSIEQQFSPSFEKKNSITKPPSFSQGSIPEVTYLSQSKNQSRNSIPSSSRIQYEVDGSTKFYELLYYSCNKQYSFEKRIEAQQKLNEMIGNFTNNALQKFGQFVQSKSNKNQNSVRYSEQKIDEGMSRLDIGNYSYKTGYVSTQAITINQTQRVYYNEISVKNIKREMKVYDTLHSLIIYHLKNMGNEGQTNAQSISASLALSQSKPISLAQSKQLDNSPKSNLRVSLQNLRVPLCSCFQYKGLMTLVFDESQSSAEHDLVDKQKLSDWRQMLKFLGFNSSYFKLKYVQTKVGELIIAYITSYSPDIYITQKPKKHHNVTFQSPMSLDFLKKSKLSNSSTSTESVLRYIKSIKSIKDTSIFTCPKEEILTTLQYCYLAKYIRKLYRAAQGEIDELNFVNLIVKGEKKIADMLESAGMEPVGINKAKILGIFFEILMYYTGIRCQVDADCLSKYGQLSIHPFTQRSPQPPTKIVKYISIHPRALTYTLTSLELYQSFPSIPKFISQKQYSLANKSISLKQGCYCENQYQQCYPWPAQSMYLLDEAQINFVQNDYITSIRKSQQFLKAIASNEQSHELSNSESHHEQSHKKQWMIPSPTASIPAYFLMLKCYSKFSKQKFIEALQYTIQTCAYNFGQQSSMMITLYSFAGVTFEGIGDHKQAELFLLTAIKMSEKICSQYSKIHTSSLYLDMSKMSSKYQQSASYLQKAQQIIDKQGTYEQKINLQINFISILLSNKVNEDNQNTLYKILQKCQNLIVKQKTSMGILTEYYHHVYLICYKYNMRRQWEACIENLWNLNHNAKVLAIKLAYQQIAANYEHISKQQNAIVQKWGISPQKSILLLEQNIKNYNGLMEMMNECFLDEDMEIISACFKLLRNRQ